MRCSTCTSHASISATSSVPSNCGTHPRQVLGGRAYFTPCDGEPLMHRPRAPYRQRVASGISRACLRSCACMSSPATISTVTAASRNSGDTSRSRKAQPASPTSLPLGLRATQPARDHLCGRQIGRRATGTSVHRAYLPRACWAPLLLPFAFERHLGRTALGWPIALGCRSGKGM